MGEWKRVFCHPRRLALLALMTIICAGLFFLTLMERVGPEGAGNVLAAGAYADQLTRRLRAVPAEERAALLEAEEKRLGDFYWYWYDGSGFASDEEALASAADVPGLAEAARGGDLAVLGRSYRAQLSVLEDISAQLDHTTGYAAYLDEIQARAEVQSQTSLFGKENSFARRNLAKTAEDFKSLLGVEAEFGNSRGVEKWLSFRLGDYFHLIAMVLLVMTFLEERKKGLWPIVRASRGGRVRLGLTRIGILLAGSALAAALFNAIPLLLSMAVNGGWADLGRSLQSLESFGTCTLRLSIAEWLMLYFALKVFSGALIGLLLWCLLGTVANVQLSLSALGAILGGEFALYTFLPVQSPLNVFKYFNFFSLVHTATLYTEYLNVDLFGFPVGIRTLTLGAAPVLLAILAAWALCIQRDRRPEGNRDLLSAAFLRLNRRLDILRDRLSLGGWEGYKTLVFQYGVLLLVLAVVATGGLKYLYSSATPSNPWYDAYLADMEGPITEATDRYMVRAREIAAGEQNAGKLLPALDRVEQRVADLRQRAAEGSYEPWIVNDYDYEIGYGSQNRDTQRFNAAIAVTLTALLAAPLWAFERQAGVTSMLRSTPRGRKRLFRRKALMAALLGVFVWGCVYLREMAFVARYDYDIFASLAAPVGNLDALAAFPVVLTFGQYLALLYALRLVMLIGVGEAALAVGLFCSNVPTAYMAGTVLLSLPALLAALGISMFQWVSPLIPVASAELLWGLGSGRLLYALPWLIWLAAASAGMYLIHRRWT